jgi:iron complex outermembrane receptor protein
MRQGWLLLVLPLVFTLHADDSPASEKIEPVKTTVTVTGMRSPMEIEGSPVATSLVTREEMESRNIRQIDQALTLSEGVISFRTKGPSDNDFGLGLRGFAGRGGQSRTLILVDGQPVNSSYIGAVNWSTFAVNEMERVEVARGPFSSLYGGNAMGGVVNLITRPVDRRRLELFGQMGSRDTTNYSLNAADRFFGRVGLSFGYSRFQTGGYSPQPILRAPAAGTGGVPVTGVRRWLTPTGGTTYEVGERGNDWFNQDAYRLRGEYSLTKNVFASVQYMRQRRGEGWDAYRTDLRDASGAPVDSGLVSFVDVDGVTRRLSLTPSNFIGTPTGGLVHIVQAQVLATLSPAWNVRVAGGWNRSPGDWYVTPAANATLTGGGGSFVNQTNQGLYGNIQVSRQASGQSLIFGTETRHDRARIASQPIPNYALRDNGGPYDSQGFGKAINQAAYVQYQKTLGEGLNVVAGGRWDYWRTYDGGTQTGATTPVLRFGERSTNAFTGKIAATYRMPGNLQLRASVGNAFRNPSIYEMYRDLVLSGILYSANPNVQPERLLAWDLGVQRSFSGGHAVEASYFENRVSDLIYRTTDFAADPAGRIRRLTNAGLGRTRGVELSARQTLTPWLNMRQFYTWNDPVITSNPDLPDTVGRTLPFVPRHTTGYLVTASKSRWTATWGGRYVSSVFSTDTNTDTTRGVPGSYNPFFEMEAAFSFQVHSHVSLIVSADNLLDRQYYMSFLAPGRAVYGGLRFRL